MNAPGFEGYRVGRKWWRRLWRAAVGFSRQNGELKFAACTLKRAPQGLRRRIQLPQPPARRFTYHRLRPSRQLFQRRTELLLPGITHGDRHVAQKPRIPCARDRAAPEHLAELLFGQRGQILQRWREVRGGEGRFPSRGRAAVPRTHILADIAAKNVASDGGPRLFGRRAAQLDGEVRNAQPRIERPRGALHQSCGHDGLRRARLDAERTRAATVRWRLVRLQVERKQQLAQKEPGAHGLVNEAGVLGDPAQSGMPCVSALQQRRSVHANLPLERRRRRRAQTIHHARQSAPQHLVVILAPRVARDPRQILPGELPRVGLRPVVELAHAENRPGGRQQMPRIVPQTGAPGCGTMRGICCRPPGRFSAWASSTTGRSPTRRNSPARIWRGSRATRGARITTRCCGADWRAWWMVCARRRRRRSSGRFAWTLRRCWSALTHGMPDWAGSPRTPASLTRPWAPGSFWASCCFRSTWSRTSRHRTVAARVRSASRRARHKPSCPQDWWRAPRGGPVRGYAFLTSPSSCAARRPKRRGPPSDATFLAAISARMCVRGTAARPRLGNRPSPPRTSRHRWRIWPRCPKRSSARCSGAPRSRAHGMRGFCATWRSPWVMPGRRSSVRRWKSWRLGRRRW